MTHQYAVQVIMDHFPDMKADSVMDRLRYSTFVSVPKRYMYFEVPKAACTQMKELLRTLENGPPIKLFAGGLRVTRRDMFVHARQNVPLPSLAGLDDKTQREVLESPNFFRMTVVRNPYTRLASAWKNRVFLCEPGQEDLYRELKGRFPEFHTKKSLIAFDEFVDYIAGNPALRACDAHLRPQVDHTFFDALNFSCLGRLEDMAEALRRFQRHLGLAEPLPAHLANATGSIGAATYDQALADRVYSLYQADFHKLGYDRNTWPSDGQKFGEAPGKAAVPEEKFRDEIIERNIIISSLYQERDRLQAEIGRVSRVHLLGVVHALFAIGRASRRALRKVKTRTRTVFRW